MIDLFAKLEEIKRANQQMRNETADAYNLLFNGIGKHIENNYAQQQQIAGIQSDTQSTLNALETGATPTFKTAQGASNYGTYQIADRKKQVDDINAGVAWMKENNKPLPADWQTRSGEDKIAHINKEREIYARDLKLQQLNEADARELSMFNKKEAIRTANDMKFALMKSANDGKTGGLTQGQVNELNQSLTKSQNMYNQGLRQIESVKSKGFAKKQDGTIFYKNAGNTYSYLNGKLYYLAKNGKWLKADTTKEQGKNILKQIYAYDSTWNTALTNVNNGYSMMNTIKGQIPGYQGGTVQPQTQGSQQVDINTMTYEQKAEYLAKLRKDNG